jgi:hypothetical protein
VEAGGFAAELTHGALSAGSFDSDLAAALNGQLGAGQSALFTADSGSFAGRTFAIVDANGQAGYQAGQDFVIELANATGPLGPGTDIFI